MRCCREEGLCAQTLNRARLSPSCSVGGPFFSSPLPLTTCSDAPVRTRSSSVPLPFSPPLNHLQRRAREDAQQLGPPRRLPLELAQLAHL